MDSGRGVGSVSWQQPAGRHAAVQLPAAIASKHAAGPPPRTCCAAWKYRPTPTAASIAMPAARTAAPAVRRRDGPAAKVPGAARSCSPFSTWPCWGASSSSDTAVGQRSSVGRAARGGGGKAAAGGEWRRARCGWPHPAVSHPLECRACAWRAWRGPPVWPSAGGVGPAGAGAAIRLCKHWALLLLQQAAPRS